MGQEVITKRQKEVIKLIADDTLFDNFYLAGGTALSVYYLQHRVSDDLDFFSPIPIDTVSLHAFMQKVADTLGSTNIK